MIQGAGEEGKSNKYEQQNQKMIFKNPVIRSIKKQEDIRVNRKQN